MPCLYHYRGSAESVACRRRLFGPLGSGINELMGGCGRIEQLDPAGEPLAHLQVWA